MARTKKSQQSDGQAQPDRGANDLLKAKLRQKFHLLRDEPLPYHDIDQLKDHVCSILGMNRPTLDSIIIDL